MLSYLKILRPSVILLTAFAVFSSAFVSSQDLVFVNYTSVLVAILVAFLIAGAGNAANDYFDYDIDRINKPKRVLPSGKIKRRTAIFYASALFILANALAFVFLNYYMVALVLVNTIITILYNWKIKRTFLGHFVDSWLASSTFLFGGLLFGINTAIIFLFSIAYLGNLGREITKGIEDMEGDKKSGARTLPVITGRLFSSWAAIFFVILAIIMSIFPYIAGILNMNYLLLIIFSDLIFALSCFILLFNPTKAQKIMKVAMFVAIFAFLMGVY